MDKKLIYRYFAVACIVLGALSCVKEELPSRDEPVGDGESEISFGITHRSLSNASLGGTRSETGDAIGEIDDIFVVWYRENGTLAGSCYVPHDRLTVNEAERDTRPDGTPIPPDGETSTRHAEFKCTLPYGRYRIYAAVNMGDLTNDARIGTERDFRNIRLEWNGTKIVDNDQMSGYFKVEGEDPADSVAVIDRPNLRLHAWVRRAVSKVTVAFDARKLNENIYIYIQSARIKDIPRSSIRTVRRATKSCGRTAIRSSTAGATTIRSGCASPAAVGRTNTAAMRTMPPRSSFSRICRASTPTSISTRISTARTMVPTVPMSR